MVSDLASLLLLHSASHIGERVRQLPGDYDERILMWCREETLENGRKLTEVINEEHENVKYLPGQRIPSNVVAVPDLRESVSGADILIFVIPHQFVKQTCETLKGQVKPSAFALTLIKVRSEHDRVSRATFFVQGFYVDEQTSELSLVSEIIGQTLNIPCLSMMGGKMSSLKTSP